MSYYQCHRCLFISRQKTGMNRHLDKKNRCIKNIQSYKYSDEQLYHMSLKIIKKDENNENMNMIHINNTLNDNTLNDEIIMNYCNYCFKPFSTKGNLKKHLNKHESGAIPVFPEEEYYENKREYEEQLLNSEIPIVDKSTTISNKIKPGIIQNDINYEQNKNNKGNKNNKNKSVNQTINNITVNQQFNNYNIINMKYPNGFDKDWDLSQISYEKKLLLINTCNTKYSELLKFILQNDDNLNVIIENETNTGIVYKNDIEKYIHLNKSDIIDQSLIKLKSQLNNLCDEICIKKDSNFENIQKYQYETLSINKKFDDYSRNNNGIKNDVQDIIFNIFDEKKDDTINIMNKIIETETNNNLLKNGF